MFVYVRMKQPKLAEKVFREITLAGMEPDVIAYTTLINAHYKTNNYGRVYITPIYVVLGTFLVGEGRSFEDTS
jgi:pentatricopeptide repeat protein